MFFLIRVHGLVAATAADIGKIECSELLISALHMDTRIHSIYICSEWASIGYTVYAWRIMYMQGNCWSNNEQTD